MKTPTTPAEVYGAEVLRTGTVVPSPRTPAWTPGGASPRSRQPTAPTFSVRGDNYHFGLCTLHLRGLPAKYEDERALKHALAEMLQFGGSTARVLQVTVRPTDSERSTAWALATFSSVMSANKILAKYESTSLANMEHKNSMGMLGHGFEVHALDVIKAKKSRGQFKTIYEKSKRKAAAKMQQLIEEKQKAEHWVNKRRITPGGMDAPRKNIMPASYTFNTCTLHVGKIPTMKSLGAISTTKYEAAVAKLFQDRLEQHKAGKVVQVTIRHREYTTCRETGDEIPALSWGLVTLDSQSAVASVQQCVLNHLSDRLRVAVVFRHVSECACVCWRGCFVFGRDDLSGLELNPIDLKQAYFSVGDFGRIFAEGQRRAGNYVAELKGEGKNLPLNSLQRHRHMRMTASIDLDRSLAGVEQPGTKLSSAKPGSSPQTSKETPLVGIASARPHTGSDRSHVSSGSDSLTYRHRGYATGQVCPSWFTPRMPSVKRPGRDLPDHWPTSPVSRERTHTKLMRLSQINLCGRSDADRKREVMRERRVERNRADDFAGYRAAFQLMDADSSGQVCSPSDNDLVYTHQVSCCGSSLFRWIRWRLWRLQKEWAKGSMYQNFGNCTAAWITTRAAILTRTSS